MFDFQDDSGGAIAFHLLANRIADMLEDGRQMHRAADIEVYWRNVCARLETRLDNTINQYNTLVGHYDALRERLANSENARRDLDEKLKKAVKFGEDCVFVEKGHVETVSYLSTLVMDEQDAHNATRKRCQELEAELRTLRGS